MGEVGVQGDEDVAAFAQGMVQCVGEITSLGHARGGSQHRLAFAHGGVAQ